MPLHKIKDFDHDYQGHFDAQDIIGYDLYTNVERVGSVEDLLVDDEGKIRYLIINMGVWIFGKKVLLPIGCVRIYYIDCRVAVPGLTPAQVEALPEYDGSISIDYDYEERVRNVYRPTGRDSNSLENSMLSDHDRHTYDYDRDRELYDLDDSNHQNLRLYQERLIANKMRRRKVKA